MNTRLLLKEKEVLLKNELDQNLKKKLALELEINKQFGQLKRIETLIEKGADTTRIEQ
jgi:hypothetical protein